MALRMAEGSLFATLLRSPWWYSFLIALIVVALGLLIAGGRYLIFGITAALPFFGISIYALYRQLQMPSKQRIIEVQDTARKATGKKIADKIAASYVAQRYEATPFKGEAADLVLTRGSRTLLLCSKRFKAANTGIEPLKKLVAAGEKVEAYGYLYVTLGKISDAARDYAKQHDIEFIQATSLAAHWDGKYKVE